jgi:hypothetical protein
VKNEPGKMNPAADALSRRDENESGVCVHAISRSEFALFDEFCQEPEALPEVVAKKQEIEAGTAGAGWSISDDIVLF